MFSIPCINPYRLSYVPAWSVSKNIISTVQYFCPVIILLNCWTKLPDYFYQLVLQHSLIHFPSKLLLIFVEFSGLLSWARAVPLHREGDAVVLETTGSVMTEIVIAIVNVIVNVKGTETVEFVAAPEKENPSEEGTHWYFTDLLPQYLGGFLSLKAFSYLMSVFFL